MRDALPFGVGGGLVAIKTLLSRDPCVHANTAIEMIDAILKEHPAVPEPVQEPDLIARLKHPEDHYEFTDPKKANAVLMSLCQEAADALAAPVQEPVAYRSRLASGNYTYCTTPQFFDNAEPLYTTQPAAPVREPVGIKGYAMALNEVALQLRDRYKTDLLSTPLWAEFEKARNKFASSVATPPAAPTVQEPVAVVGEDKHGPFVDWLGDRPSFYERNPVGTKFYTTPPAQPAVPDAMTSADIQENIEYVAGWNDCRQAMLEMMK